MKRKLSLLLCAALTLSLLAGCGPKNTGNGSASGSDSTSQSTSQNTGDRTQVDFMVLSGPTGVGAAKLLSDNDAGTTLNDYNAEVVTENGQIQTALTSGEVDIAAIAHQCGRQSCRTKRRLHPDAGGEPPWACCISWIRM